MCGDRERDIAEARGGQNVFFFATTTMTYMYVSSRASLAACQLGVQPLSRRGEGRPKPSNYATCLAPIHPICTHARRAGHGKILKNVLARAAETAGAVQVRIELDSATVRTPRHMPPTRESREWA